MENMIKLFLFTIIGMIGFLTTYSILYILLILFGFDFVNTLFWGLVYIILVMFFLMETENIK